MYNRVLLEFSVAVLRTLIYPSNINVTVTCVSFIIRADKSTSSLLHILVGED